MVLPESWKRSCPNFYATRLYNTLYGWLFSKIQFLIIKGLGRHVSTKVLSETKRTIGFVLFKNALQIWFTAHIESSHVPKFCFASFWTWRYAWFHVIICSTFRSVKKNKKYIFPKLHTSKALKKSAFTNLWSKNLFEWIQNPTKNYVGIILSVHTLL